MAPTGVTLRPIDERDMPFLLQVYASTRADELTRAPWDDAEKQRFLTMQFDLQHRHYQEHYPDAEYRIVLLRERPVGRLYLRRAADHFNVIDIALLPEYRGKGIGGGLMRDVIDEARQAGLPVRVHVERENPARHLYERLGFRQQEQRGVYDLMEWSPETDGIAKEAG